MNEIRYKDCYGIISKFLDLYGIITNELDETLAYVYGKEFYENVWNDFCKDNNYD